MIKKFTYNLALISWFILRYNIRGEVSKRQGCLGILKKLNKYFKKVKSNY